MSRPTREEVELWKCESAHSPLHDHAFENHNRLICLADAYLSQEEELKELVRFMRAKGYVPCDIETCNCGSYHGGHSARRLTEIGDVLSEHRNMNGVVILDAVKELLAENKALKEEIQRSMYHEEHLDQTYSDEEDTLP